MLEVEVARQIVFSHAVALPPILTPLSPQTQGQALAADVISDLDSPPFDKALMDGYAVRSVDLAEGPVELRILEEVAAGSVPTTQVGPGEAVGVFTGAPLPAGIDAVVMKERCEVLACGKVRVNDPSLKPGKSVMPRGEEMRAGDVILHAGTTLTPVALGLMAALGQTETQLFPRPVVGVIATGDELVEPPQVPTGGQIRNSNGPLLCALAVRAGAMPHYHGIARDNRSGLVETISGALASCHVVLLAGGVSAGKFDLVPEVLANLGVEARFHQVRMKPGKPLYFGTYGSKLVFGLPGNPVSALVAFELFVRPALRRMMGETIPVTYEKLPIAIPHRSQTDRPTYHPARIARAETGLAVRPLPWLGSADLRALQAADALIVVPSGTVDWQAGTIVEIVRI